jgi:hypothetical protein
LLTVRIDREPPAVFTTASIPPSALVAASRTPSTPSKSVTSQTWKLGQQRRVAPSPREPLGKHVARVRRRDERDERDRQRRARGLVVEPSLADDHRAADLQQPGDDADPDAAARLGVQLDLQVERERDPGAERLADDGAGDDVGPGRQR